MKKLNWMLTLPLVLSMATPTLYAAEKSDEEKIKQVRDGAAVALSAGAGAYLTREKPLYKDALHAMPMDEGKEKRIVDVADDLLKKADTSNIPDKGLINKARIQMREMNRPIVAITKNQGEAAGFRFRPATAAINVAEELPAEKSGIFARLAKILSVSGNTRTEMDVLKHGGREHLMQQLDGLKNARHVLVTDASVHSAARKLANKSLKVTAAAGVAYAAGKTGLDLLEIRLMDNDLKVCDEKNDGSVVCSSERAEKKAPARGNGKKADDKQDAANAK